VWQRKTKKSGQDEANPMLQLEAGLKDGAGWDERLAWAFES
jgi:hypothetical protein